MTMEMFGLTRDDLIDGMGEPVGAATVIGTGGLGPLVISEVPVSDAHEPWLTLIGLRLVWERNAGPAGMPGTMRAETNVPLGGDRR